MNLASAATLSAAADTAAALNDGEPRCLSHAFILNGGARQGERGGCGGGAELAVVISAPFSQYNLVGAERRRGRHQPRAA